MTIPTEKNKEIFRCSGRLYSISNPFEIDVFPSVSHKAKKLFKKNVQYENELFFKKKTSVQSFVDCSCQFHNKYAI